MFYTLSKLFWIVAAPSSGIALLFGAAAVAWALSRLRLARRCAILAASLYFILGIGPVGALLLTALENRFARPAADMPPPDGIVVLGGAMDDTMLESRHAIVLAPSGTRMTEAVALALRYPQAKLVFTGGSADISGASLSVSEADVARQFFVAMGLPPERAILENRSRNTYENAIFTRDLVQPKAGERWLLVTSATHIPRAVGIFRKAGFDVIAWPAHYFTSGRWNDALRLNTQPSDGLSQTDVAVREWIGLVVYRLTGRSAALFPAP